MPNDAVVAGGPPQARWPDACASPPLGRGRPIVIAPAVTAEPLESHADAADDRRRSDRHVILYLAVPVRPHGGQHRHRAPGIRRDPRPLRPHQRRQPRPADHHGVLHRRRAGSPFYGPFSDRFGRGPVLRVGMVVYVLGARAPRSPVDDRPARFRFVWGLGAAGRASCGWRSPATSTRGIAWRA